MTLLRTVLAAALLLVVPAPAAAQTPSPSPSPTAGCPYVDFTVDRTTITPGETVVFTARRVLGAPGQQVTAQLTRLDPEPQTTLAEDSSTRETVTLPVTLHETTRIAARTVRPQTECAPLGRPDSQVFTITVSPSGAPAADCADVRVQAAEESSAWGLDGRGGVQIGLHAPSQPNAPARLLGYVRPSTEVRELARGATDAEGRATFQLAASGSTRVWGLAGSCSSVVGNTAVAVVRARLGGLTAHRRGVRDYTFSAFYAGPAGKVGSLYRVLPDGREVLTAQTRLAPEWVMIRRVFTGSGRFGFVLRTGDDVNSLGTSTNVRDTVVH